MTRDSKRFLQPEAISRIARLEIKARNIVEGFLNGSHRSPYFGQSVEFAQHREYAPGDDVRRIDWKVWSKTDKYYVKQFEEETNLRTTLLVDLSESMQFGSGDINKYDYACSVAASIAYLLLRQQDAVGLNSFDDEIRAHVPIRSQQNHLSSILTGLCTESSNKKTDLFEILRKTAGEHTRKGLIVLVSDLFADREGLMKGLKLLRHRGHDVMVFHILDDEELDFTFKGTTKFIGLEETGELTCDPKGLREGYLKAMNEFIHDVKKLCASQEIDYQTVRTSEHVDAVLMHYMNHRLGMRVSARN